MESTREVWERLAKLPGGGKDPFRDPYGPTTDCFSDNDIVRMFQLGAETLAVEHFAACAECSRRVEAFSEVTGQRAAIAEPVAAHTARKGSGIGSWMAERLFGARPAPAGVPTPQTNRALVYAPNACSLDNGLLDTVRLQLLGYNLDALRDMKVYLAGSIVDESQPVAVEQAPDASGWIVLRNIKASQDVVTGLKSHTRVTEQLEVRIGKSAEDVWLVGTTNIEIRRSSFRDS